MKTSYKIKKQIGLIILSLAFIVSFQTTTNAQQNAIGVRLGSDPGITYKHYFAGNGGVELLLHTGYRGLLFTGLYEWHLPFKGAPGLYGVLGMGAHFGVFNRGIVYRRDGRGWYRDDYIYSNSVSFGIDGIFGLEYRIPSVPLTLGLDIKPSVDLYRRSAYLWLDGAISLRYRF